MNAGHFIRIAASALERPRSRHHRQRRERAAVDAGKPAPALPCPIGSRTTGSIQAGMRIVHDGRVFNITGVAPDFSRRQTTVLFTEQSSGIA